MGTRFTAAILALPGIPGGIELDSRWPIHWLLLAAIALLALVAVLYLLDLQTRQVRRRRTFLFLRLAAIAILLLLFLQPVRYRRSPASKRPTVAILIDTSASMGIEEESGSPSTTRSAQAASLLAPGADSIVDRVEKRFQLKVFTFDTETIEVTDRLSAIIQDPKHRGSSTALGQALLDVAERLAPQSLAAQVVLTDGAWNAGPEPVQVARRLGARSIPVFPVALGTEQARIDAAIESVVADEVVLPGDRASVEVVIRGEGLVDQALDLRIQKAGVYITGSSPTVQPDGLARSALTFDLPADTPPNHPVDYSVWIPPREGEISEADNRAGFRVRLVDRPLKVLLVDELPRWEFRYLKNALLRDPGIDVESLLLDFRGVPVRGEAYRQWYPDRGEALAEFDVIILGDVSPARFSPMQLEATRGFVDTEGGSIVVQAGVRSSPAAFLGTPLEELLPVSPQLGFPPSSYAPFAWMLTPEGRSHPVFAVGQPGDSSPPVWEELPGFQWFAPAASARPAATVLATHPFLEAESGNVPLMVSMRYGHGRVVYLGVDATWRWRFGIGDEIHHRFWGRLLRWLAENRFQGGSPLVRLNLDRRRCLPGEEVEIRARVLDRDRYPLENADVQIEYESDRGERGQIPLLPDPERRGHYHGRFAPREAGEYTLHPRIPALAGEEAGTEVNLTVRFSNAELAEAQPDHDLLDRIATASGGRLYRPREAAGIAGDIPRRRPPSSLESKTRLWDSPYVIIVITALLGTEWWLRKRRGLA